MIKIITQTHRGRSLKRSIGLRIDDDFIEDLLAVPPELRDGALQMLDDPHIRRRVRKLVEREAARRG